MYDVFISYATENEAKAVNIKEILQSKGLKCWFAPSSIRGSEDYTKEIPKGIEESKAYLLLMSAEAQKSEWVHRELGYADEKNRKLRIQNKPEMPIFVLYLDGCELEPEYFIRLQYKQHYLAQLGFKEQMTRLLTDLGKKLGKKIDVNVEMISDVEQPSVLKQSRSGQKSSRKKLLPLILGVSAVVVALILGAVLLFGGGLRDGAYVIWNPDHAMALSGDVSHDYYLAGEEVLSKGDTLSNYSSKCVWELDFDGDTFTISRDGQLLGMKEDYNGIGLGGDHIYVEWVLDDRGDGLYYIMNKDTGYYLEWYEGKNNWCGHNKINNGNQNLFLLRIDPAK